MSEPVAYSEGWNPYCLVCSTMDRMIPTEFGWRCGRCGNEIGHDLAHHTRTKAVAEFPAGPDHRVVEVHGTGDSYRRKPCEECPWRVDKTGGFPAEAFRHSANTAEDAATHTFGCHMNGTEKPVTCAGFLLRNADHNLAVRRRIADGRINPDEVGNPDGLELHADYRAMSIANGVDPADPAIAKCRGNEE